MSLPTKRVLAIVGTKGPFPRLVSALQMLAAQSNFQIRVQHASRADIAPLIGWAELPRADVLAELEAADAVVCHAGSGTIRDALRAGHRPIVVPRLQRHGEHVNDHQLELTSALGARIVPIADLTGTALVEALRAAIDNATREPPRELPGDHLRAALKAEVDAIAAAPASARKRFLYDLLARFATRHSR